MIRQDRPDTKQPDVLKSLSEAELKKVKPITEECIQAALEVGMKERDAAASLMLQGTVYSRTLYTR